MARRAKNPFKTTHSFVDYLRRNYTFRWIDGQFCMENGDNAEQFILNKMSVCLPYMSPKIIAKAVRWLSKTIPKTAQKTTAKEPVRTVSKTMDIQIKLESNNMILDDHSGTVQYVSGIILVGTHGKEPSDNTHSIGHPYSIIQTSHGTFSNIDYWPSLFSSRPISRYLV